MKKLLLTHLWLLTTLCVSAQTNTTVQEPSEDNPVNCTSYITNPSFEDGSTDGRKQVYKPRRTRTSPRKLEALMWRSGLQRVIP